VKNGLGLCTGTSIEGKSSVAVRPGNVLRERQPVLRAAAPCCSYILAVAASSLANLLGWLSDHRQRLPYP